MKILKHYEVQHEMLFAVDKSGKQLGCIGTRILMQGREKYLEIDWLLIPRTAPEVTGKKLIAHIESNLPFNIKRIVVNAMKNDEAKLAAVNRGFVEFDNDRFEKRLQ